MTISHEEQCLKEALGVKKYDQAAWEKYLHLAENRIHNRYNNEIDTIIKYMRSFHEAGSTRYRESSKEDGKASPNVENAQNRSDPIPDSQNQDQGSQDAAPDDKTQVPPSPGFLDILFDHLHPEDPAKYADGIYDFQDETKLRKKMRDCKILIITANQIELNTLHYHINHMNGGNKITRIIFGNVAYFVFRWGKYQVAHVHQQQLSGYRDLGTHTTLEEVLRVVRPNVIFSLGVAFGIDPKNQNVGDVLVSRKILPYSENKIVGDMILPDRSQDKTIDSWLDVRLSNTIGFLENVTYGSILSGSSVLSSYMEKARICAAYSANDFVIGGEMEGHALFRLCGRYDIPCAVIKGICDWGAAKNAVYPNEPEKEDHLKTCAQAYAMTQVVEKCDILFQDGTLFSHPKTRAADAERQKSIWLTWILTLSNLCLILLGLFTPADAVLPAGDIPMGILLLLTALINFGLTILMHYFWSRRYLRYPRW